MAKVLILSNDGEGYSLGKRIMEQGDEVSIYIQTFSSEKEFPESGPEVLAKVPYQGDYDLIIPTVVGFGRLADRYRKAGKTIFSGGSLGDLVETNEFDYSTKLAKVLGIKLAPGKGIPITFTFFFNGREVSSPFIYTIHQNRLMDGNKGPVTEFMGCTTWIDDKENLLTESLLPQLIPFLRSGRYTGPFSLHSTLGPGSITLNGFGCTLKFDQTLVLGELTKIQWFPLLQNMISHAPNLTSLYKGKYAVGVRLSVSPYPYMGMKVDGANTVHPDEKASTHVWTQFAQSRLDGGFVPIGVNGVLGCITAWGETVREAQRRVYRTVKNVVTSDNVQYRMDIGEGVSESILQLKEWQWLE